MSDQGIKNSLQTGGLVQNSGFSQQERLRRGTEAAQSFQSLLNQQLDKNGQEQPLKISKHAQERMGQRGIEMSTSLMTGLREAVDKARDKGAKDLVVIDASGANSAYIVNVPNNTIVTTMSGSELKENIFTNIDSAVLI